MRDYASPEKLTTPALKGYRTKLVKTRALFAKVNTLEQLRPTDELIARLDALIAARAHAKASA